MRAETDYRWLHSSGYTLPHAVAGQIGDPADVLTGIPAKVRHKLIRAAEALDDAYDAVERAVSSLSQVEATIDADASRLLRDDDPEPISQAERRQAERQQVKRQERALPGGNAALNDEVTG